MEGRFRGWLVESADRVLASDPGLGRLRMAFSGVFSMGTALGVVALFAAALRLGAQQALVAMLLGAVVAMMGSMALSGPERWAKARIAVFFPVAMGAGLTAGVLVAGHTDLMLSVFVAIMFVAVFIRRFGRPFFFYGFMAWMGYFFASFLHATVGMLPVLISAVAVSSAWVLVLSMTMLRTNPRRTLRRTLDAYAARTRSLCRDCFQLLEADTGRHSPVRRRRRRLRARQAGLAEAALMVEGWSEDPDALPVDWSGPALRRRLLDIHHVLDRLAASALALSGKDPSLVRQAGIVLEGMAQRADYDAGAAARQLAAMAEHDATDGSSPARHLALAALEFLDLVRQAQMPPAIEPADDYSPTIALAQGNLPGTPSVARDVPARGTAWNPLARLDMTSRQAVQVAIAGAIAILIGRDLSPTRYYWAVIAAFVVFTGTATRSETSIKAFNRVLGTLVGLVAAVGLAHLTSGSAAWALAVILASMFCGFYLIRISYAYMIFFVTIMLGQLYSLLHTFSDATLVLRLEETGIGAAAGIAVALLVIPLSTGDAVRAARDQLLTALSELLVAAAEQLESTAPVRDLDALSRALDDRARQLALVAKPLLVRPMLLHIASRHRTRHRLVLYGAVVVYARALTVGLRRLPPEDPQPVADACRALAEAATRLMQVAPGRPMPALGEQLGAADAALFRSPSAVPESRAGDPVFRPLLHIKDLLTDLSVARPEL